MELPISDQPPEFSYLDNNDEVPTGNTYEHGAYVSSGIINSEVDPTVFSEGVSDKVDTDSEHTPPMPPEETVIKLHISPHWDTVSKRDIQRAMIAGGTPEELLERAADHQEIIEKARDMGITIIRHDAELPDGPADYTGRGLIIPREQEEAELRAVIPEILIPETVGYEQFDAAPFFPAVAKNGQTQQGMHKYLLETPEQWQKMRMVLHSEGPLRELDDETMRVYLEEQAILQQLTPGTEAYDRRLAHVRTWDRWVHNFCYPLSVTEDYTGYFDYERYIETPSDRYTSYRVVVSAVGKVLARLLCYSDYTKDDAETAPNDTDLYNLGRGCDGRFDFLTSTHSLAYLGGRQFQSNISRGGHGVVLNPTERSKPMNDTDKAVVAAHGLDPERPQLPRRLEGMSQVIGQTIGRKTGLVVGIDWIQQSGTDNYYYLETNGSPGAGAYANTHYGGDISPRDAKQAMHIAALKSIAEYHRRPS